MGDSLLDDERVHCIAPRGDRAKLAIPKTLLPMLASIQNGSQYVWWSRRDTYNMASSGKVQLLDASRTRASIRSRVGAKRGNR